MRQVWKGMIVGAATGAGVGMVLEGLAAMSRGARSAADEVRQQAPAMKESARDLADRASERLREAELGDRAQTVASKAGEKLSEAGSKAGEKLSEVGAKAGEKAGDVGDKAREKAASARASVAS